MKIEHLNATFQPAKIGNPHGLQITYLKDNSTRNIFVYHEDGKVRAGGWQGLACAPGGWCCMQPDWGTPVSNPAVTWGGGGTLQCGNQWDAQQCGAVVCPGRTWHTTAFAVRGESQCSQSVFKGSAQVEPLCLQGCAAECVVVPWPRVNQKPKEGALSCRSCISPASVW